MGSCFFGSELTRIPQHTLAFFASAQIPEHALAFFAGAFASGLS